MRSPTPLLAPFCLLVNCCQPRQPYVGPTDEPGNGPKDVVPDLPAAEACADASSTTLEEMARGMHAGERVAFDGVPRPVITCTEIGCSVRAKGEWRPRPALCCNDCYGYYVIPFGEDFEVVLRGLAGCSGMDCGYHCEPFGIQPAHKYRFVGLNDFRPKGKTSSNDSSYVVVEQLCLAE